MKIIVLMGGCSGERNVSLASGKAVFSALKSLGHEVMAVDPSLGENGKIDIENMEIDNRFPTDSELAELDSRKIIDCINSEIFDDVDMAFNMLHGKWGEDGHVQSLLSMRGIKQTGSSQRACAVAMDKIMTKYLLSSGGVHTPEWASISPDQFEDYDVIKDIRKELGNKLVIKPYDQGSALGMTIIEGTNLDDISDALKLAGKYTDTVLVEKFIAGREITVSVIEGEAYPIVEIKPHEGFYDYTNKYTKGKTEYICPADIDEHLGEFIRDQALTAHHLLGCKGFSRVDFRLDQDGGVYCLELNTVPGFTELSLLPMAARAGGLEFPELCQKLINIAE
jgi:D-alanine-D-alanine ligase